MYDKIKRPDDGFARESAIGRVAQASQVFGYSTDSLSLLIANRRKLTIVDYTHRKGGALMPTKATYSTEQAAEAAGISKSTLLRWIKHGVVPDASRRDRNNWRVFTRSDVSSIKKVATNEQR